MGENSNEFDFGNLNEKLSEAEAKGGSWVKAKYLQLEKWAGENTQEAKQNLLSEARRFGAKVREDMNINEIKNKVKAAIRNLPHPESR